MITKKTWQDYIDRCLIKGAECDRLSDLAYAEGDHRMGGYWGKIAIAHYTAAEKASELRDEEPEVMHRAFNQLDS